MWKKATVTISASAQNPDIIAYPNTRVKAWDYIRYNVGERWIELVKGNAQEFKYSGSGTPEGYYSDGVGLVYLDKKPTTDMTFDIAWWEYTDWPTNTALEPIWLTRGYNALLGQVFIQAGTELRDNDLMQRGSALAQQGLAVLLAAEEELRYSGTAMRMRFSNMGH
jgi:hypothetical protein